MERIRSVDCPGTSTWVVDEGGQWFPVEPDEPQAKCVAATLFVFEGRTIKVSRNGEGDGLPHAAFIALLQKFPDDVVVVPGHPDKFTMPKVNKGTKINIS